MTMKQNWLWALWLLPLVAGCSSFNREWKQAVRQPIPADEISGPWEGRWMSGSNGHHDRLRCVISAGQSNVYHAFFHANYKTIFHFSYTVPLQVRTNENGFAFSGEADLGKLKGGTYTYEGNATPTAFHSTYHSKYDNGKFEMSRPAAEK